LILLSLFIFTIPTYETSNLNVGSSSLSARTSYTNGLHKSNSLQITKLCQFWMCFKGFFWPHYHPPSKSPPSCKIFLKPDIWGLGKFTNRLLITIIDIMFFYMFVLVNTW